MHYSHIIVSTEEYVQTVTLNRPDKLNAWTHQMDDEFRHAIETAASSEAVRAIVVTGAGRGFCAGADMSILEAGANRTSPVPRATPAADPTVSGDIDANYKHRFSYLLKIPKPIFAAINGPVAGIGLCMTMFCDFRYMAQGQKLTTAFSRRGLIAEHGISWILPRLIGPTNALDLLFTGRTLLTEEVASMGLVRSLPVPDFLASVQSIAREMVSNASPRSIRVIKQQVYDSLFQNLDQAWRQADQAMSESFASEDFREGVAHYLEKRAPVFTGR